MRKWLWVSVFLVVCFVAFVPALAEATEVTSTEGYDWSYLGTIAGATAAVPLIVQYTKRSIDRLKHVPTRAYVYTLSLAILLCAQEIGAGIKWVDVPLIALNAVVVATSAMGSYELTYGKKEEE